MGFEKVKLSSTIFYDLIQDFEIEEKRIPEKDGIRPWDWYCAYDKDEKVLFTQLKSSSGEMRDHNYYYLLIIESDPIFI